MIPARTAVELAILAVVLAPALGALAQSPAAQPKSAAKSISPTGIPYLPDDDQAGPPELLQAIRARRPNNKLLNLDRMLLHSPNYATAWNTMLGTIRNKLSLDGKEAFIAYFTRMAKEYPGKRLHIVRSVAEGDLVALHCRQEWPGDTEERALPATGGGRRPQHPDVWAGMDFFRFDEKGKIVEHWDVLQRVPEKSENRNTMF